jgi:Cu(I)/Ag(I) efflux system periplasmic protein CusF
MHHIILEFITADWEKPMKKFALFSTMSLMFVLLSGNVMAEMDYSNMNMGKKNGAATAQKMDIQSMGKLNSINTKKHKVNISHGPIPELNWPPMRMDFAVKKNTSLAELKPGQKVHFVLMKSGKYEYIITKIFPMQ